MSFTSEDEFREAAASMPDGERKEGFIHMMETLRPWETLHPDLVPHIELDGPFGASLKHPLVFDIMYAPGIRDGMLNALYAQKCNALEEYAAEGNWSGYVFMHERPYRLHALTTVMHEIEDDCDYWRLVGHVWTDSENIWQNYSEWSSLLREDETRTCKESMMDDEEKKFLAGLPDEFLIWRGYNADEDKAHPADGFSWTVDKSHAEWFARRFAGHRGDAWVVMGRVKKADVLAYFNGRGEEEIVVLPENVAVVEREPLA